MTEIPPSAPCKHKHIHTGGDDRIGYFTCLDCGQEILICFLLDKMLHRIERLEDET